MSAPSPTTLADLTTLRVGGPAAELIRCPDTRTLVDEITLRDRDSQRTLILGGGSNLLVGDAGFEGAVIRIESGRIEFGTGRESGRSHVTADAGVSWDDLVAATVEAGYGGLECLSGIPGAAGATPVQNVGAYGVEVAELLRSVQVLDRRAATLRWVSPSELGLAYRTSTLKGRSDYVVVAVSFWLNGDGVSQPIRYRELATALGVEPDARVPAARARTEVLALRASKGMVLDPKDHDTWSSGSFFTNPIVAAADAPTVLAAVADRLGDDIPVPTYPASEGAVKFSAGWLIERAGFTKGYPNESAPARLSTKHTLALTNRGTATAEDILSLAREVQAGVRDAFGVTLRPEPVLVGCAL